MKLLKNRKFAILLTIVIAVLATLFGVYKTSVRYTRSVEAMFYDGVYLSNDGYTQPAISSHLENSANAALGLATLMGSYPELADKAGEIISARRDLLAAGSISDKSSANLKMNGFVIELLDAAMSANLTDRDKNAASQYYSTFIGASNAIANSSYNVKVADYMNGRSILMRIIGAVLPVKTPDFFNSAAFSDALTWPWNTLAAASGS